MNFNKKFKMKKSLTNHKRFAIIYKYFFEVRWCSTVGSAADS